MLDSVKYVSYKFVSASLICISRVVLGTRKGMFHLRYRHRVHITYHGVPVYHLCLL